MKKIFFLLAGLFVVGCVTFQVIKYFPNVPFTKTAQSQQIQAPTATPVPVKDRAEQFAEYIQPLIAGHIKFVEKLTQNLNGTKKQSRFMDLFAPLGVLDPYADETGLSAKESGLTVPIQNIEFGYFAGMLKFSEVEAENMAEAPLRYANEEFDETAYFKNNQAKLASLESTVSELPDLKVLGLWPSGLKRVNNTFIDSKEKLIWKLDKKKDFFYDFNSITLDSATNDYSSVIAADMASTRGLDSSKIDLLLKTMSSAGVTTLYRCQGKTIYILVGTADNGFGFIHGASSANEVNCGYLSNRFEIMKDEKLDENWRFWIGR